MRFIALTTALNILLLCFWYQRVKVGVACLEVLTNVVLCFFIVCVVVSFKNWSGSNQRSFFAHCIAWHQASVMLVFLINFLLFLFTRMGILWRMLVLIPVIGQLKVGWGSCGKALTFSECWY